MLDNPDDVGIYPTSTAYTELEHYIECMRAEAIGWMHADACTMLDRGEDPRIALVPDIYYRAMHDLAIPSEGKPFEEEDQEIYDKMFEGCDIQDFVK